MVYYNEYIESIKTYDHRNLIFLDETHYDVRKHKFIRSWGPKGVNSQYFDEFGIDKSKNFTLTLMISYKEDEDSVAYFYKINEKKNDAIDFVNFVFDSIESGFVNEGKILIADNAPIHVSSTVDKYIDPTLTTIGAKLKFLPKYSPGKTNIIYILIYSYI